MPPPEVIQLEVGRAVRGHFNLIHIPTALKADVYPLGEDPLHRWGFPRRRKEVVGGEARRGLMWCDARFAWGLRPSVDCGRHAQRGIEEAMDRLESRDAHDPHSRMGHFRVAIRVGHRAGGRFEPIEALVDTGATYTWIPREVLEGLGVAPEEDWPFVLADGREVRYPVAWVQLAIGERVQPTIAVFGERGSEPILGVFALEGFRLAADPVNRRLISVPGLLKGVAVGQVLAVGSGPSIPPSPFRIEH